MKYSHQCFWNHGSWVVSPAIWHKNLKSHSSPKINWTISFFPPSFLLVFLWKSNKCAETKWGNPQINQNQVWRSTEIYREDICTNKINKEEAWFFNDPIYQTNQIRGFQFLKPPVGKSQRMTSEATYGPR